MTNYKMICLDLDGTLLCDNQLPSQKSIHILRNCIEKGIHVVLVSGRPYFFTKYIANMIDPLVKVIASNGGCYEKGSTLIKHPIKQETLKQVILEIERTNSPAFFKNDTYIYTHEAYDKRFLYDHFYEQTKGFPFTKSYVDLTYEQVLQQANEVIKILVYDMNPLTLKTLRSNIANIEGVLVSSYNDISFDVNARGIHKGQAIEDLLAYYTIDKAEVMAIGDGENDLAMFESVGLKVAMGNAKDTIKEKCDVVTSSYQEEGVYQAIKQYIKEC